MERTLGALSSRSAGWLASIQNDGGGWGEYKGAPANVLNTAESVLALLASGQHAAGDANVQRAITYLETVQLSQETAPTPKDRGAWAREIKTDSGITRVPDTVRSSFALLALNAAGRGPTTTSTSTGTAWLENSQNDDGGWGYTTRSKSWLLPTCLAVLALLQMHHAGEKDLRERLRGRIENAIKLICGPYKNGDGSFGSQPGLLVAHSLYVVETLKQANREGFGFDPKCLDGAVEWISAHFNEVTQWCHETIELGDAGNLANYTFTHVTPALYLRAFGAGLSQADEIAQEALRVLHDSADPLTGGFAAKRAVSWATAKSLVGLAAVDTVYQDIPGRSVTKSALQARHYTLFALLGITVLATVLALMERLGVKEIGFFTLIITAILLIYGYISEKNFVDILLAKRAIKSKLMKE